MLSRGKPLLHQHLKQVLFQVHTVMKTSHLPFKWQKKLLQKCTEESKKSTKLKLVVVMLRAFLRLIFTINQGSFYETKHYLTLADAEFLLNQAQQYATEHAFNVSISIVDETGNLLTMKRMDGAAPLDSQYIFRKSQMFCN